MVKIVIIQRIFPHYRREIFDKIFEKLQFELWHTSLVSSIEQTETDYSKKIGFIKYSKDETKIILNTFTHLLKAKPKIIIHEFSIGILTLVPTLIFAKLLGIKFILWGHGYDRNIGFKPNKRVSDRLRLFLMKAADALLLYGQEAKKELSRYVNSEKIFVAQNTLNTDKLLNIKKDFEIIGRQSLMEELGFTKKYNLIFIGRLLKDKKPELCIELINEYTKKYNDDIMLHIVGDGVLYKDLMAHVERKNLNKQVRFYGSIYDDILTGKLLYCSDLMIMPGYLGLSINHAFCFECPVVSFAQKKDGPFHSPEIEYVIQDKTGYLADDFEDLKIFVSQYLNDYEKQIIFKQNINDCVNNICAIDNMTSGFADAVKYCENLK